MDKSLPLNIIYPSLFFSHAPLHLNFKILQCLSLSLTLPLSYVLQRGFYLFVCLFVWSVGEVQRRVNKLVHLKKKKKMLSRVNGTYIERHLYKNSIYENLNQAWRVIPYVKMMFWQWWIVHFLVRIRIKTPTLLQLLAFRKQFWLCKTFCRINSIGVWNSF